MKNEMSQAYLSYVAYVVLLLRISYLYPQKIYPSHLFSHTTVIFPPFSIDLPMSLAFYSFKSIPPSVRTWRTICLIVVLVVVVCGVVYAWCSTKPVTETYSNTAYSPLQHGINNINSNLLANHKVATSRILQLNDIPCPRFVHVHRTLSADALHQLLQAYEIPYPVVVKPVNGNQGKRVIVNLNNAAQAHRALVSLLGRRRKGKPVSGVIVEEQVQGMDFRILMLNHKVFDVVCRMRATVIGDGVHTLDQLIQQRNQRQRRDKRFPTKSVSWRYVAEQLGVPYDVDHDLDSTANTIRLLHDYIVPPQQRVIITNVANNHNGCNPVRVPLQSVHPDNIAMFERISQLFRLKMVGIDYMTPDIAQSYHQVGHIIEVNSGPGMDVHRSAYPRDKKVVRRFVRALVKSVPWSPYE